MTFDPSNIYLWISEQVPGGYFDGKKVTTINCAIKDLVVVDFDYKYNALLSSYKTCCGAYVETNKGYHFLFSNNYTSNYTQQDKNYERICLQNGYWSQLFRDKKTGAKRIMILNKEEWRPFVDKWNYLVNTYEGA